MSGPEDRSLQTPDGHISPAEVTSYYDNHVKRKLRDFVDTNRRVEAAWATLLDHVDNPASVLEIGCGIGAISWRMASHWPDAQITGCDISPESIRIAERLFERPNLRFVHDRLDQSVIAADCDVILMMDVLEHVPIADRHLLFQRLRACIAPKGKIVLTFPTPDHLQSLRDSRPDLLQPVDEDVTMEVLTALGDATGTHLTFFREVSIWTVGDYAHAILESRSTGQPVHVQQMAGGISSKFRALFHDSVSSSRAHRLTLVNRRLGIDLSRESEI
jgi:2-polyprenyl-3-methyl-5-hydroxy-6-metoxy-1,4-benzoquinol methylase